MGWFKRSVSYWKDKKTHTGDDFLYKYLKNGASADIAVDGSVTPVVFEYVVPAGKSVWLYRLNTEGHNGSITRDNFLGLAALANGLKFEVLDNLDNVLIDFTDGFPIKITTEFSALCGVDTQIDTRGGGEDGIAIRWTFTRAGEPIFMAEGYKFRVTVQDNLTGISQLRMMLQGLIINRY